MNPKDVKYINESVIGRLPIGKMHRPLFVAEISANHNGSLDIMMKTIEEAIDFGADVIKIQTYKADRLAIDTNHPNHFISEGKWRGQTLYELYKKAETPYEWHDNIFNYCKQRNVPCISTPFHPEDVEFLSRYNPPAYKIASFEIEETNLLSAVAKQQKPVILSCGLATWERIDRAMKIIRYTTILLHCVSEYPAKLSDMNMNAIEDLKSQSRLVGLSDHSLFLMPSIIAVARGACMVEKHVCLRGVESPDSEFSIPPTMIACYKEAMNQAFEASKGAFKANKPNAIFMRSVYATEDIRPGEKLTIRNIGSVRPVGGLPPSELPDLLENYQANRVILKGEPLAWNKITRI